VGFVQSASGTSTSSTTVAAAGIAATGAGNTIIVCAGTYVAEFTPHITGISFGGLTFTKANAQSGTAEGDGEIWYAYDAAGGHSGTLTVTFSASGTDNAVDVIEWAGIISSSPLDQAPAGASSSDASTWTSNATGTLAQPAEVAFGVVLARAPSGTITITGPGSPWTLLTQLAPATNVGLLTGYQQVSATSALTYNGTMTASSGSSCCIATFKLSTNVTAAVGVAMAPMALALAGTETITGAAGVAMAPMALALAGTETITGAAAVAMAPMALALSGQAGSQNVTAAVGLAMAPPRLQLAGQAGRAGAAARAGDYDGKSWWKKRWILRL